VSSKSVETRRLNRIARIRSLVEELGLVWVSVEEGTYRARWCAEVTVGIPEVDPGFTFYEGLASAELWLHAWKRWHAEGDSWQTILNDWNRANMLPYDDERVHVQYIENLHARRLQQKLQAPQEQPLLALEVG